jgi:nicotinamidase-related amidase
MSDLEIDSPGSLPGWIMPWPSLDIDWTKTGLLVIDLQNYSCNPQCGVAQMIAEQHSDVAEYYLPRIDQTISNTRRLLDAFRGSSREVVFTRHGALLKDGRDMILRRRRRDTDAREQTDRPTLWVKGSSEHNIVDLLAPADGELVIDISPLKQVHCYTYRSRVLSLPSGLSWSAWTSGMLGVKRHASPQR